MNTVLHIGCGPTDLSHLPPLFHQGEWQEIRLDIDESVYPDIVASMLDMSIVEDGTVSAIYSSHNVEHLFPHEVPIALAEFRRVLRLDGVAVVKCPDVLSVAKAIVESESVETTLYDSPSGPIAALDILYGHREALAEGNHFMAHKTAFTARSLARALFGAGFQQVVVTRDVVFGLHALAYPELVSNERIQKDCAGTIYSREFNIETVVYTSND
ncbi:methyltransferase domain-containing protein [Pseudomonas sp. R3.Fl]|uniref:class I SAM-dependent methyltransferase n=1 Tax=Pseudomonas sp. R3.Fl TaxID=2928708 RepID=UPI00201E63E8|nr:methyltransferase domain-containing protein [Pseudomonas sp. R3.Fl]MCL6689231.1 methyltransferase domain-containing protein [Pseudomonas sp. R3.Fl]